MFFPKTCLNGEPRHRNKFPVSCWASHVESFGFLSCYINNDRWTIMIIPWDTRLRFRGNTLFYCAGRVVASGRGGGRGQIPPRRYRKTCFSCRFLAQNGKKRCFAIPDQKASYGPARGLVVWLLIKLWSFLIYWSSFGGNIGCFAKYQNFISVYVFGQLYIYFYFNVIRDANDKDFCSWKK
jgi:hypothetical protein